MSRLLFTLAMFALLVGLGALAVAARPFNTDTPNTSIIADHRDTESVAVSSAQTEADLVTAAAAPAATNKWNAIALPLDVTDAGVLTADNVANYIATGDANVAGTTVPRVRKWNPVLRRWIERYSNVPGNPPPIGDPNFSVSAGDSLMVLVSAGVPITLTWVGKVPDQDALKFPLTANARHMIMIPLDQYELYGSPANPIATADSLANDIGGVTRVLQWDATRQRWIDRYANVPGNPPPLGDPNFAVYTGYPYWIVTNASAPAQWP